MMTTIALYADRSRSQPHTDMVRAAPAKNGEPVVDGANGEKFQRPSRCLSDFVAPKGVASGLRGPVCRDGGHRHGEEKKN